MTTRNFAEVIRAKYPRLASAVLGVAMKEIFRKAVVDILESPFTGMHTTMWRVYKDHLRDINPEDLPQKVRLKFDRIREIMEGRVNRVVKQQVSNAEYMNKMSVKWGWAKPANEETDPLKVRAKVEKGYPLTSMNGAQAAEFRRLIFEIYDLLPKRTRTTNKSLMSMLMEMD